MAEHVSINDGPDIPDMEERTNINITRWEVVCTNADDQGSQRCRMPLHLANILGASIGASIETCLDIDFGSRSVLCTLHIWPELVESYVKISETVSLLSNGYPRPTDKQIDSETRTLPVASFKKIACLKLVSATVTIVLGTHAQIKMFNRRRSSFTAMLPELLSQYVVRSGCEIDCRHSQIFQKYGIKFVAISECASKEGVLTCTGRLLPTSKVKIGSVMSRKRYLNLTRPPKDYFLGGLEGPRQRLCDMVLDPFLYREDHLSKSDTLRIACPRGVLLIGPPGTGKTSLVRSVADQCRASLVYVTGPSLCRSEPGGSQALLRKIFQEALDLSEEGPCILFIDEVDSVLAINEIRGKGGHQSQRLVSSMLMSLLDDLETRGNLVFVGATNRPHVLDPAVRRAGRFDHEIYLGAPTKEDRESILKQLTAKFPMEDNVNLAHIAEWTPGFVGADLVLLCQEVASSKSYLPIHQVTSSRISEADFRNSLECIQPSTLRGSCGSSDFQRISWDDIGGLEDAKKELRQSVEWATKFKSEFIQLGLRQTRGILLYGPPGCCKTTLVRACATSCNFSFLHVTAADIYSPFFGDSEKEIREVFHRGRVSAPAILFIDEIDAIVGKRDSDNQGGVHEKVLSTMLNEMDGIGISLDSKRGSTNGKSSSTDSQFDDVIVIAATNRLDLLDDAILRPGRFDKIIYVPPPDDAARLQILQIITKGKPVKCNLEALVQTTAGYTGADLKSLYREAALQALTSEGFDLQWVLEEHFTTALSLVKPSVSPQQLERYERLQQIIV